MFVWGDTVVDENMIRALYRQIGFRPASRRLENLANGVGVSLADASSAASELMSRGLVTVWNDLVIPTPWWNANRIDLFLNVPRLPREQFDQYCREIDVLVDELRAQDLPVLRPYTNETALEILIGAAAVMVLARVAGALGRFIEQVTKQDAIPYVDVKGIQRMRGRAEVVVSIRGTDAEGILRVFQSVMDKLARDQRLEQSMTKARVLFLSANATGTDHLRLDEEIREITAKIQSARYRDSLELISRWAVRPDDLLQSLLECQPTIVHFSGHGSESEEITLIDDRGIRKPVGRPALVSLFRTLKDNVRIVVLNACYSRPQAEAIAEVTDCAIGMDKPIGDKAAIVFAASFYRAIGFARSVQEAFDLGVVALQLDNIPEARTPALLVRKGIDASEIVLVRA